MGHVDPCDVYGSPVQQPKQPNHHRIATLLPSSNSFTGMFPHVITAVEILPSKLP